MKSFYLRCKTPTKLILDTFLTTIMRAILLLLPGLLFVQFCLSQHYTVKVGETMEAPNREKFLSVIHADDANVYLLNEHYKHQNYNFKSDMEQVLYKLDQQCNVVYKKHLTDEFGQFFGSVIHFKGQLFLFGQNEPKKNEKYIVTATIINATDGKVLVKDKTLATIDPLANGKGWCSKKVKLVNDGNHILLTVNQVNEEEKKLHVFTIEPTAVVTAPVSLTYSKAPHHNLIDQVYLEGSKIIFGLNNYEYTDKKKRDDYQKDLTIFTYDTKGTLLNKTVVDVPGKYISTLRTFEPVKGKVMVSGFYSNERNGDEVNGIFSVAADVQTGNIINRSSLELTQLSMGHADEGSKKALKGVEGKFHVKHLAINPVNAGYLLVAENNEGLTFESAKYNNDLSRGFTGTTYSSTHSVYSQDILIAALDANGNIKSLHSIPKSQVERSGAAPNMTDFPLYSSFAVVETAKGLHLVFNDHSDNEQVTGKADKFKKADDFDDARVFILTVDFITGAITRKAVTEIDNDKLVAAPKNFLAYRNNVYFPASKKRPLGKSEFKLNKITIQ